MIFNSAYPLCDNIPSDLQAPPVFVPPLFLDLECSNVPKVEHQVDDQRLKPTADVFRQMLRYLREEMEAEAFQVYESHLRSLPAIETAATEAFEKLVKLLHAALLTMHNELLETGQLYNTAREYFLQRHETCCHSVRQWNTEYGLRDQLGLSMECIERIDGRIQLLSKRYCFDSGQLAGLRLQIDRTKESFDFLKRAFTELTEKLFEGLWSVYLSCNRVEYV